ncbi:glycosyl transferase [Patiriisocius marinistellae]|uniref:Glycosyl transferase n=1 Tax=Patiriisocius marinistellae TaxID=2494560 RepID=A0A5J4FZE5_9FLAO|nr:glycosyltransferase [Patiriisocius marinistellae]GEQ86798.1 glycosyl transferase [Patiriisocius marinistellae]
MKLLVVTLAPTLKTDYGFKSYAPYVKEMNIWMEDVSEVTIVSPTKYKPVLLTDAFKRNDITVKSIPFLKFSSPWFALKSVVFIPFILFRLILEMKKADHIHLRCPGNIGLLGCLTQVFFPSIKKTAKYAGNWDPKAEQPLSYRFQKWLLSNTFWTKNMQVLVYGDWFNQSKNIKSFFTASYRTSEICQFESNRFHAPFSFLFVGSLVNGKRPIYAIKLIEKLIKNGFFCSLKFYGDGIKREELETYVVNNNLQESILFMGNQNADSLKLAYQNSDFSILPSKSEGWPKVLAEAMFWGAIPIATPVSCVPWMLNFGERGVLLNLDLEKDKMTISKLLSNREKLLLMSKKGIEWSQQYTLDTFETEIKKLLK